MRAPLALLLLSALLVVALLPGATAHGPPQRRDPDTRVLVDWNDDCGGDGGASLATGACRGSHDLIGLDLVERHDAGLGDVVVFRFFLDKGTSGARRDTLSVGTPSGTQSFSLTSSDAATFTATGFDRSTNAQSLNDGTRFVVEGTVQLSKLGSPGQTIGPFKVEAFNGNQVGDYMPGGCNNTVGTCPPQDPDADIAYELRQYKLAGPTHYLAVTAPSATLDVPAGGEAGVTFDIHNQLARTAQTVTVAAIPGAGVTAGFHASGASHDAPTQPTATLDLAAKGDGNVHLMVKGSQEGAKGVVKVWFDTDQGGHQSVDVPYRVVAPGAASSSPGTTAKPAPVPLAPLALLAAALLRRSR
ncbi:MAG: hypothetical protein QOD77_2142 [Thermoplasmata archaeon]|jgi:hypothetical protein|nr:hypothetical protein [Thermoplasmata archaeon]